MTFSLDSYRELIQGGLTKGFRPMGFCDEPRDGRTLLLRHDVDYSLEMAVHVARVNAELGVAATFFILVRAHGYNPRSKASASRLEELVKLGQRIGVHVAGAAEDVAGDFECLSQEVQVERVFSWHNPTSAIIERYRDQESVAGLTNVYSRRFLDDALYRSDSNLDRRYEELASAFDAGMGTVHLLLHPINWVAGGDSMLDVFEHAWPYLIREAELEARTNRVYSQRMPDGVPDAVLEDFAERWRKAAR